MTSNYFAVAAHFPITVHRYSKVSGKNNGVLRLWRSMGHMIPVVPPLNTGAPQLEYCKIAGPACGHSFAARRC